MALSHRIRPAAAALLAATALASTAGAAAAGGGAPVGARIVGGAPAQPGAWPSLVALVPAGTPAAAGAACGGTLIAPAAVLTAAHCVVEGGAVLAPTRLDVVAGSPDLALEGERIPVARIEVHPGYRAAGEGPDAAVLILARPSAAPVAAVARPDQDPDVDRAGRVAGWGALHEGDPLGSTTLRDASLTILSSARCGRLLGTDYVAAEALCAGVPGGGVDTCTGDSGGPLSDASGVLIGVTSWGNGCGRAGSPGVYTRVSRLGPWIAAALAGPASAAVLPAASAPARAPRVRAMAVRARAGGLARLRYRISGEGQTTREQIIIRAGRRVVARLRTDAGPALPGTEYVVSWRVPARAGTLRALRFCVTTRVVDGPAGRRSCAPLRLARRAGGR